MSSSPENAIPVPPASDAYWREFLRVNADKLILLFLICFMIGTGADERLVYAAIGGLTTCITHNRWQRNP